MSSRINSVRLSTDLVPGLLRVPDPKARRESLAITGEGVVDRHTLVGQRRPYRAGCFEALEIRGNIQRLPGEDVALRVALSLRVVLHEARCRERTTIAVGKIADNCHKLSGLVRTKDVELVLALLLHLAEHTLIVSPDIAIPFARFRNSRVVKARLLCDEHAERVDRSGLADAVATGEDRAAPMELQYGRRAVVTAKVLDLKFVQPKSGFSGRCDSFDGLGFNVLHNGLRDGNRSTFLSGGATRHLHLREGYFHPLPPAVRSRSGRR